MGVTPRNSYLFINDFLQVFILFFYDFGRWRKINFRGNTISILFQLNQIYIFHIYGMHHILM